MPKRNFADVFIGANPQGKKTPKHCTQVYCLVYPIFGFSVHVYFYYKSYALFCKLGPQTF